jgi:hypothetical protein
VHQLKAKIQVELAHYKSLKAGVRLLIMVILALFLQRDIIIPKMKSTFIQTNNLMD